MYDVRKKDPSFRDAFDSAVYDRLEELELVPYMSLFESLVGASP